MTDQIPHVNNLGSGQGVSVQSEQCSRGTERLRAPFPYY